MHRTSASTAVKSLRWLAKHLQWPALQSCVRNSLVASYCKQIAAYDKIKKQAVPIPAALIACCERMVCNPQAPLTTKLILGAALVCIHASIRFGDAQRLQGGSIQLSASGMHATAFATKTTKSGQPFACTWHGYTGRNASSSWVLHWLASIASISTTQPELLAEGEPQTFCSRVQTCSATLSHAWPLQATHARSCASAGHRNQPAYAVTPDSPQMSPAL